MRDGIDYFLVDIARGRWAFSDLQHAIREAAARWKPSHIFVEAASSGIPIEQELRRTSRLPILPLVPKGSKIARAEAVSHRFESGRVKLPQNAHWAEGLVGECTSFPVGRFDDQVDAVVHALTMIDAVVEQHQNLAHNVSVLRGWMQR